MTIRNVEYGLWHSEVWKTPSPLPEPDNDVCVIKFPMQKLPWGHADLRWISFSFDKHVATLINQLCFLVTAEVINIQADTPNKTKASLFCDHNFTIK